MFLFLVLPNRCLFAQSAPIGCLLFEPSPPRPKAAIAPWEQDFAASAEDPKKLARLKGSNHTSEAGFCCLRRRPEELN